MPICTRCSCYKNEFGVNCVPYSGNPNAEVYFLGEMAGRNEAATSVTTPSHFIGSAGTILDELLPHANLTRADIAIANAHRCYKYGNATPTQKEMDLCFIHTIMELSKIQPKMVVAMGESALYQLTGKTGISGYRGKLIYSQKIGYNVFPVYHPMASGYDAKKKEILIEDFKKIPKLINSKPEPEAHFSYIEVDTIKKFNIAYNTLITSDRFYFDTETTGKDPFKDKLRTLQMGNGEVIYVVGSDILYDTRIRGKLIDLFTKLEMNGQNFSFDVKFLYTTFGIFPEHWGHDSLLAEFVLSGVLNNDLRTLTSLYNRKYYGYDDYVIAKGGAHKVYDTKELYQYGADDVGVLYTIKKKQRKMLIKNKQLWLLENITIPCDKALTRMSLHGVRYDLKELNRLDKEYKRNAEIALSSIQQLDSIKVYEKKFRKRFNPRSTVAVHWLLLEQYKLPVIKTVKKSDRPSIGSTEMETYAGPKYKNPYCKRMSNYRSLQGIRANFLSGVVDKLDDGIAHTNYALHIAASGRPASSNPNLQNIPSNLRSIVIPRNGRGLLHADLGQIEVRMAAVIYHDQGLIDICNKTGYDFHSMIASKIYGYDYESFIEKINADDKKFSLLRKNAKGITFGVLYQEQAAGLAYELGVTQKKAQEFIDDFYFQFPGLAKGIADIKKFIIENGYADSYFGFRRRWKHHTENDTETLREGVNHPIQSTAWNLMQLILIQVDEMLIDKDSKLILQTYDDLVIDTVREEEEEIAHNVKSIMENVNKPFDVLNEVAVVTDVEIGNNLRDLKKYL